LFSSFVLLDLTSQVERLLAATPAANPGRVNLEKLYQNVISITSHLDSRLTEANHRHKVYSLQDLILNAPILAIGDRMFVREQSMTILFKGERVWRHVILFNDAIMSLKHTKKKDIPFDFDWLYSLKEVLPFLSHSDVARTTSFRYFGTVITGGKSF